MVQQEIRFDSLMFEYAKLYKDNISLQGIISMQSVRLQNKENQIGELFISIDLYRDLSVTYVDRIRVLERRVRRVKLGKNVVIVIGGAVAAKLLYDSLK